MPSMPRDNCCFLACDKSKDFFCESNDDTSGKSKKTVCSLRRVVGLQRKSDLHDTEAEQDKSDCTDKSENEIGQIVYNRDRVFAANAVTPVPSTMVIASTATQYAR